MKVEWENNVKIYCPADCATAAGRIDRICCLLTALKTAIIVEKKFFLNILCLTDRQRK